MRPLAFLLLATSLAGCTLAPAYERPTAPVPASFPQGGPYQAASPAAPPVVGAEWKGVFGDPRLQGLIQTALIQNRNLRQTVANVRAAEAQFEVQRSALLPRLAGGAVALFGVALLAQAA